MTYRCVLISTLLLASCEEAAFHSAAISLRCSSRSFECSSTSSHPSPIPNCICKPTALELLPSCTNTTAEARLGKKATLDFSCSATGSCCCVNELPPLSCTCMQQDMQWTDYSELQIVAPSTELRPQPLISALQNISPGR